MELEQWWSLRVLVEQLEEVNKLKLKIKKIKINRYKHAHNEKERSWRPK
jgi:hypothetical protein